MYGTSKATLPLTCLGMLLVLVFSIPSVVAAYLEVGSGHTYPTITDGIDAAIAGDKISVYGNGGTPYV
ncbi:MAG: hypothetical protein QM405_04495 [Euryarchaeota archaeon]|nr:hypothetical protein [Euryarchaeota archaeon]